jgi:hypothetical protein
MSTDPLPTFFEEAEMLNITEAAGEYLTAVLERAHAPDDTGIRLRLADDALAPSVDSAHPDDEKFDHNGRTVLLLDASVRDYLSDSMLDIEDTPDGPKLLILR